MPHSEHTPSRTPPSQRCLRLSFPRAYKDPPEWGPAPCCSSNSLLKRSQISRDDPSSNPLPRQPKRSLGMPKVWWVRGLEEGSRCDQTQCRRSSPPIFMCPCMCCLTSKKQVLLHDHDGHTPVSGPHSTSRTFIAVAGVGQETSEELQCVNSHSGR